MICGAFPSILSIGCIHPIYGITYKRIPFVLPITEIHQRFLSM